jgi:hypothetical protein
MSNQIGTSFMLLLRYAFSDQITQHGRNVSRAEFGLLTPSAVVVKTSTLPDLTQLSETKVTWGRERSHDYRRETIK